MGIALQDAVKQLSVLMDEVDEPMKMTFQNVHQGCPNNTIERFLKAREWNVSKAHNMLVDCLNWRIQNQIDDILAKPIIPAELYRGIRDSQLVGLSGYSKEEVEFVYVGAFFISFPAYIILCCNTHPRPSPNLFELAALILAFRCEQHIQITVAKGLPVFAIGAGLSTFDKASVHYYVQSHIQVNEYRDRVFLPAASKKHGRHISTCIKVLDMTGLKLSALSQLKLLTLISTVDDLNYPEKTATYYIVNVPYIFSACWKVVKPLLQQRTRKKVQVLQGSGRDELLKIMDYDCLPHFCKREGSGSSRYSRSGFDDCFSLDHPFHQQLYNYIKQQALLKDSFVPVIVKQGSFHVDVPDPDLEGTKIVQTIESELHKIGEKNGLAHSLNTLKIESA